MTSILVVDDEVSILHMVKAILASAGLDVHLASSAQEALEVFKKESPDLAVVDFCMPEASGIDFMVAAHGFDPAFPVIVMSGNATMEQALESLKSGAIEYIAKPFRPGELIFRVRKSLELKQLRTENRELRIRSRPRLRKSDYIVGSSKEIKDVLQKIDAVAKSSVNVLISGESGTGKELVARAIHHQSLRCDGPFVTVNCGAIPEALLENELFGHVKGAYTGAHNNQKGQFHAAHLGTLFLDEIGELPMSLQAKLLRFLQSFEFKPLGGTETVKVDVRLIAATNRELTEEIRKNNFRDDLYYRIHIVPIEVPPLRARREDIPLLAEFFLRQIATKLDKRFDSIAPETITSLMSYDWPGNVREVENVITRMAITSTGPILTSMDIPLDDCPVTRSLSFKEAKKAAVAHFEKGFIIAMLKSTQGNITAAARKSGKDRKDFWSLMKKYGICADAFKGNDAHSSANHPV